MSHYTICMNFDSNGKLMLSFLVVFADLLRGFVKQPWLEHVDLSSSEQLKTEHVTDEGVKRLSDMVWKLRKHNGESLYVMVMVEIQSTVEHFMAARMNMYVGLLYDVLARDKQIKKGRKLPQVVPLVLYSGERKWSAPLELSQLIADNLPGMDSYANQFNYHLVSVHECAELDPAQRNVADAWFRALRVRDYPSASAALTRLIEVLKGPEHDRLRAAVTDWFQDVVLKACLPEREVEELGRMRDLTKVKQMLGENMVKWSDEWIAKGEARGIAKGEARGLAKGEARGIAKGEARGLAKGEVRGQRRILVRLAQARFGAGAAAELASQLDQVNSLETLDAIGEWLVSCASSEALFAKMRQA